ncbi:MAG: hypothetical protein KC493_08000 [Bacteriovoracaceae bacterium]|nr:hypothetical protein [Bacteriovoracaceae bacterium]
MKKLLVVLLMVIFAASIKAGEAERKCFGHLTDNFKEDRNTFTVDLDVLQMRDYRSDKLAKSIRVVRELLDDLGCSPKAINFGWAPQGRTHNSCKYFDLNHKEIQVCYIGTNLGYFTVHEDYLFHMTVNFYRWD